MPKATDVPNGEWMHWDWKDRHICCECGLAHDVEFQVQITPQNRLKLHAKWTRNERSTALGRRNKNGKPNK